MRGKGHQDCMRNVLEDLEFRLYRGEADFGLAEAISIAPRGIWQRILLFKNALQWEQRL